MPSILVELECCGQQWLGKVTGPRAGRDIREPDIDAALAAVRRACDEVTEVRTKVPAPMPVQVSAPPAPQVEQQPRRGRGS